jgi:hypothetical protein
VYEGESIVYRLKVFSKYDIDDVRIGEPKVDGVLVQSHGEAQIYNTTTQAGKKLTTIEIVWIVTPLEDGKITIPPIVVEGNVIKRGRLDSWNSILNNMQGGTFSQQDIFSLASNEIVINVKPRIASISPWVPATAFSISDNFDKNQTIKVGDPVSWRVVMVADGIISSQLPSLENHILNNSMTTEYGRFYSDKPSVMNDLRNDKVTSRREEKYTFIPQKAGEIQFPEIRVDWWDTIEGKAKQVKLPSRTIIVLADPRARASLQKEENIPSAEVMPDITPEAVLEPDDSDILGRHAANRFLYGIVAVLVVLFLGSMGVLFVLYRRVRTLTSRKLPVAFDECKGYSNTETGIEIETGAETGSIKFRDFTMGAEDTLETHLVERNTNSAKSTFAWIAKAQTCAEIDSAVRTYAKECWNISGYISQEKIFQLIDQHIPELDMKKVHECVHLLEANLYASRQVDFQSIKTEYMDILRSIEEKGSRKKFISDTDMNP